MSKADQKAAADQRPDRPGTADKGPDGPSPTPRASPRPSRASVSRSKGPLRVLVVRHGPAEDKSAFAAGGTPDAERPLTREGRRKVRKAARGLVQLVPELGVLATSPLVRAAETADLIARRYGKAGDEPTVVRLAALAPGKANSLLLGWLADQPRDLPVAVVGHEPNLGQFVSWALTGLRDSFVELKKGAACLIEFDEDVRPGRAKLLWALRPSQLRAVGRGGADE